MTEKWVQDDARQELKEVRVLLADSMEQLEHALRLPVSNNDHLSGILTRQGPQIHVNAHYKQHHTREVSVRYQQSIPQLSLVMDALLRVDRVLALYESVTECPPLTAWRDAADKTLRILKEAQNATLLPSPGSIFPEKIRALKPGIGSEVYVQDNELVCTVYMYQDKKDGRHQALSKLSVKIGDPGLLSFSAKLEAAIQRVQHVYHVCEIE